MSAKTAPSLDELKPDGYVMLLCADVGTLLLRADQLPRVRAWQMEGPPGWVHAIDRGGDAISFWWPTIRCVNVVTRCGAANERAIREAADAEFGKPDWD
ncbi:hypothetical protein [Gemmatimonas sp.]